jgi:NDP-sugar pyrophosphorylase family protein
MIKPTTAVILAAGAGSRFAQQGYRLPKPLLPFRGRTLLSQVERDLSQFCWAQYFVLAVPEDFAHLVDAGRSVPVKGLTGGAADTALLCEDRVAADQPLIIANADQTFTLRPEQRHVLAAALTDDLNVILTMPAPKETQEIRKWSYAVPGPDGLIASVVEKPAEAPSDHATVGVYLFAKARYAFDAIRKMKAAEFKVNGEFYLAPCFNFVENRTIAVRVASFQGLGTPEDYRIALEKPE